MQAGPGNMGGNPQMGAQMGPGNMPSGGQMHNSSQMGGKTCSFSLSVV